MWEGEVKIYFYINMIRKYVTFHILKKLSYL